jgi:hypothetical protein
MKSWNWPASCCRPATTRSFGTDSIRSPIAHRSLSIPSAGSTRPTPRHRHPEAGGLTSRELLGILRGLAGKRLVGADVVEVAPAYDHAEMTTVAYELLALMLLGR